MSDLSLRIKADFDEASRQFKALADSSENTANKIEKFSEKFKTESIDRFIERQDLAAVAMKAVGKETDAINSQVAAYQREIERLIKAGLDPQDEALQKLQAEYAGLLTKQSDAKQAAEDEAAAAKDLAEKNEKLADMTVKLLDAETKHEKNIIRLSEEKKNLKEEIERLIKSGISPESEEVKKLEKEYKALTDEIKANEQAHKMQEAAAKVAKGALIGIGAALAAGAGFAIKAAAANEDMIASFVPMMDGSVEKATELFKTIQKEAATTPFEIDKIAASVKTLMPAFKGSTAEATKAFRMLGDTAQGNAQKLESITNAYTKSMMKGKVSMQELNTINNAGVPIFDQLTKSMGITTAELFDMSSKGKITADDLTGAFQQMTSEGGLFFNGMESASDTFNMRLLGIKENAGILAGVIGEKLLPKAKEVAGAVLNVVESFTEWIQEGDNFERVINTLTYALAGLAGGLTAFLVISKGAVVIDVLSKAFRGLTAAIAANPIGAIAVVITTVLIPALIYLFKNWDTVQTYLQQGIGRLEYAFKWFASQIKEKFLIAVNGVKIGFLSLAEIIVTKVLGAVANLLDVMGKMPFVGEQFQNAAASVRGFAAGFSEATQEAREASRQAIQTASDEKQAAIDGLNEKLAAIDTAARARREELEAKKKQIQEEQGLDEAAAEAEIGILEDRENEKTALRDKNSKIAAEKAKTALELLKAQLEEIPLTERQIQNEQINAVKSFLQQRAELETDDHTERLAFLEQQKEELLALYAEGSDERVAIEMAADAAIEKSREDLAKAEKELTEKRLGIAKQFTGAMISMMDAFGKENRAAMVFSKMLAIAEVAMNTARGISQAIAQFGPPPSPMGIAGIAAATATGIAATATIIGTSIPSAETGTRFITPYASGVDPYLMRIGGNEEVNVTPAGQGDGGQTIHQIFKIENQTIFDIVNRGLRSGEIYEYSPSWNLA